MQSRFVKSKKHLLWIQYSETEIEGWYCTCKNGARTVGCCAHIASAIYYLSYYRYQEHHSQRKCDRFADYLDNAASVSRSEIY